jgi:hypothetical protein
MSAPTDRTRGTAGNLTEREAVEKSREIYSPFTRVWITRAADGTEQLFFGEISGTWIDDTKLDKRFTIEDYACTPTPMDVPEILDWITTGPHGLQLRTNADLPDALGETVGVSEWYPPIEVTEERPR